MSEVASASKIAAARSKRPARQRVFADVAADRGELLVADGGIERGATGRPSSSRAPWRSHCQICVREISAVAASSIRL